MTERGSARTSSISARAALVYLRTSARPRPRLFAIFGSRSGPRTMRAMTKSTKSFSGSMPIGYQRTHERRLCLGTMAGPALNSWWGWGSVLRRPFPPRGLEA